MDRAEKIKLVRSIIRHKKCVDAEIDKVYDIFGTGDFALANGCYTLLDDYIDLVARQVGDNDYLLTWFIYDNECGEKGLEAGNDGNLKPITTIDGILDIIEGVDNED